MRLMRLRLLRAERNRFLPSYQATNATFYFLPRWGANTDRWEHLRWPSSPWKKPPPQISSPAPSMALRRTAAGGRLHLVASGLGLPPQPLRFGRSVGVPLRRATHLKRILPNQRLLYTLANRPLRHRVRWQWLRWRVKEKLRR
jgi:hypothetical protein